MPAKTAKSSRKAKPRTINNKTQRIHKAQKNSQHIDLKLTEADTCHSIPEEETEVHLPVDSQDS